MSQEQEHEKHLSGTGIASRVDIAPGAVKDIAGALTALLADVFALYLKTKNFHWHMSGPHFRDYRKTC